MIGFLPGNTMLHLVVQSDMMTKIILLCLLCMSIMSWSVALYKLVLVRIKLHQFSQVAHAVENVENFKQLFAVMQQHAKTMPGYFLSRCLKQVKELLQIKQAGKQEYAQTAGLDFLQMQLGQTIEELMYQEESFVYVLTISAGVGPLLGLLGTVWGLVHSFIDISQKQSADIVTVAPGIAEALITTIAGLLIAIPAVILFYAVSNKIKSVEYQLCLLADKVTSVTRNLVVEQDLSSMALLQDEAL